MPPSPRARGPVAVWGRRWPNTWGDGVHGLRLRHGAALSAASERGRASDPRGGPRHPAHRPPRDPHPPVVLGGTGTARCARATAGGLSVRRAALDHVADLVRRAGAHEPQHEIENEANGGELQDPQGEAVEAAEQTEEDVERHERQCGEDGEAEYTPEHGRFPP